MYDPGRYFDEGISADGSVRPFYRGVLDEVGADPAASLARSVEIVRRHEVVFGKGQAKQDFVLDPVPRIVPGAEWDELERGLAQRARALNALIADIYGERRIIAEGVIPERVVNGAEYLEPEMEGLVGPNAATVIGFDLVRDTDGRFLVLEDNTRTPSGMAYAIAARSVSAELFGSALDGVRSLDAGVRLARGSDPGGRARRC